MLLPPPASLTFVAAHAPRWGRAVGFVLLVGCGDSPTPVEQPSAQVTQASTKGGADSVGDLDGFDISESWIVVFDDDADDPGARAQALSQAHGAVPRFVYRHALKGFTAQFSEVAAEAIRKAPNVKLVERDSYIYPSHVQQSAPWHLDRIDQRETTLDGRYNYFWTGGGSDVSVYIVDSGIRASHPEFGSRVQSGWTGIHDGRGTDDCHSHGTKVASVAAGSTVGVAKGAWIVPVRVMGCSPPAITSTIMAGLDWVACCHIKPAVANVSFGSPGFHAGLALAVRGVVDAGVPVVVSAGNDESSHDGHDACGWMPAQMSEAITVAATDSLDQRAKWGLGFTDRGSSNWGPCVDIWAPGRDIQIASLSGGYTTGRGTSFAVPAVVGTLALFYDENPTATVQVVRDFTLNLLATRATIQDAGAGSTNRLLYAPNFRVAVGGPTQISVIGQYQWQAVLFGGGHHSPTQYTWEYRPVTSQNWQVVGTGSTYSRYVTLAEYDFELRLTAHIGDVYAYGFQSVEVGPECDPNDPNVPC